MDSLENKLEHILSKVFDLRNNFSEMEDMPENVVVAIRLMMISLALCSDDKLFKHIEYFKDKSLEMGDVIQAENCYTNGRYEC